MSKSKLMHKLKTLALVSGSGFTFFAGFSFYKADEKFYNNIIMPCAHLLSPEKAHNFAVKACKYGIFRRTRFDDTEILNNKIVNLNFINPLGIAAGFDKNGEAVEGLHSLGFGFVEIGSVTPKPQRGNPTPRVFRLPEDKAVINRYGFNSDGNEAVYQRLIKLKASSHFNGILGVNLGKNKTSEDAVEDYVNGIMKFGPIADYLVINVSSPNTPGLRNLQEKEQLETLLVGVTKAVNTLSIKPPVFLKLAPDLTTEERKEIANVLCTNNFYINGLIISNTTIDRNGLINQIHAKEVGGLSGAPLTNKSTQMIAEMYRLTNGKYPIIGVGGVFTGQDAYDKITAGASLIQIYTSFIYHGPPIVKKIKSELSDLLRDNGFKNISEAVGKNCGLYVK